MNYLTLWLAAVLSLSACSLTEPEGPPLRSLWRIGQPVSNIGLVVPAGADSQHFYTVRGRTSQGPQLIAYRVADGTIAWRAPVASYCNPPILAASRLYCSSTDLYAFDLARGDVIWRNALDLDPLVEGTADETRVYVGRTEFSGQDTEAIAVDAATGAVVWRRGFTGDGWIGVRIRSLTLTPDGDLLVAVVALFPPSGSTNNAAVLVALDPASGAERWRVQDGGPTDYHDMSGVTVWNGLALYADLREAIAVNLTTRAIAWRAPWTPGYIGVLRAPLVADGQAYFTDGAGYAFAVDAATGARRWATQRPGGSWSHEVCGPVFVMNNRLLEVFDRTTGRARGRLLDAEDSAGQIAVADDVLYVSAQSGVYAFDCTS